MVREEIDAVIRNEIIKIVNNIDGVFYDDVYLEYVRLRKEQISFLYESNQEYLNIIHDNWIYYANHIINKKDAFAMYVDKIIMTSVWEGLNQLYLVYASFDNPDLWRHLIHEYQVEFIKVMADIDFNVAYINKKNVLKRVLHNID